MSGMFIKKYNSITEASLEMGLTYTPIRECCNKKIKTVNGFIWRRADDVLTDEDVKRCNESIKKSVSQYSLVGDFIKKYEAINIAAKELSVSETAISRCCKNKQRTAGGYLWRYGDEILTDEHIKWCNSFNKKKTVIQYSAEGKEIDIYDSVTNAQKITGIRNIASCCRHERMFAGGFIWRYADDESNEFGQAI